MIRSSHFSRPKATLLLAGAALLAACGPPKPARVTVDAQGAHYDDATYVCQAPLMAALAKLDRDRAVQIVPAGATDNYEALKIETSTEAKGFRLVGLTLATGKGAWSTYPTVPPGTELKTCPPAAPGRP